MLKRKTRQNPFFNRQRITNSDYFHGRTREMEALYSAIVTRQCRSLVGERKMGKSSLLTALSKPQTLTQFGLDTEKYAFVYMDLEGMVNISYTEFWTELVDQLEVALPATQTDLRDMAVDLAMSNELRFMQVRRLLRRLERAGITLVMMLDEFESLATNEEFDASFYGELRSLAGELGVVYITGSKQSLYDLTYRHADTLSSPFFNIFSEERLGLFTHTEADGLLHQLAELSGEELFDHDMCNYLIDLAGPHPFFLQIAASNWYSTLEQLDWDDNKRKKKLLHHYWAETEDHFRYLWDQLSLEEQTALLRPENATADTQRYLEIKAVLRRDNAGKLIPFSTTFAEFLSRTDPSERPPRARTSTGDLTGTTLGNYRVLTSIGRGGMATVYKGYQSSLDRYVAIKVMSNQLAGEKTFVERFQREASSVARLRHSNIVQMVDFGLEKDLSFMVMEYIEGQTLKQKMLANGSIPLSEATAIIRDIASALDYAHAYSIVHRDVKPANIMLRQEERLAQHTGSLPYSAVLTDFGVARMLEGVQITGTGATIGTPDYMSPEQASGGDVGPRSDIYALGIILYEMLVGEKPFVAENAVAVILQHLQASPPSACEKIAHLPYQVDEVLLRALAKNPNDRFETAGKMARALWEATK